MMINHCSETKCPANNRGSCKITNCILINPEIAVKELESLNKSLDINCEDCNQWVNPYSKMKLIKVKPFCFIGSEGKVYSDPEKGVQCPDYEAKSQNQSSTTQEEIK